MLRGDDFSRNELLFEKPQKKRVAQIILQTLFGQSLATGCGVENPADALLVGVHERNKGGEDGPNIP